MPAATNMTIMKADGTTSINFNLVSGSPGDRQPAIWRCDTFSTVQGNRPVYTFSAKGSQQGQRVMDTKLIYPELVTDSTTGITSVRLKHIASSVVTLNTSGTDTAMNEAVSQFMNLNKHPLILSAFLAGYGPT